MVGSLYRRLLRAQENLQKLKNNMETLARTPVITRRDNKRTQTLQLSERKDIFEKRYQVIRQYANEFEKMLEDNYKLYFDLLPEEQENIGEGKQKLFHL